MTRKRLWVAIVGGLLAATVHAQISKQHAFNVPAQEAMKAIPELARQAGVQISAPSQHLRGIRTPAIQGEFTTAEALDRLLKGTGLIYEYVDSQTIAIQPAKKTSAQDALSDESSILAQSGHAPDIASRDVPDTGSSATDQVQTKEVLEEIVVTGTHIRRSTPTPALLTISRQDIAQSGFTSTPQLINSLPQNFAGGSSQVVATQGSATTEFSLLLGTNTPSLRGLGDATLTLLNGRRMARTAGTNGSDLAAIPVAAIERVEVLTDGASAVYGSDAVAGVVNVILRKDYEGVQTTVSFAEPTRSGGGEQQTYSLLAGTRWERGNVLFSYTGQNQSELASEDRSFSAAAASPTSLIPLVRSNSATVYLNQAITPNVSVYTDLLYNRRTASRSLSFATPGFSFASYSDAEARQYAASAGLKIAFGGWQSGIDINTARDEQQQDLAFAFPGSPPFVASISEPTDREHSFEVHTSGALLSLPGGELKSAFGAGHRREEFNIHFPLDPDGDVSGQRHDTYAYAEFELPIVPPDAGRRGLESLHLNASGRLDHYSDFGSSTNPKVGIIYGFSPSLRLLGSYGKSFRAPLVSTIASPSGGDLFIASDPRFPGGTAVALYQSGGNPSLKPEKSESWTATLSFAPVRVPNLSLSGTYFTYDFRDKILAPVPDRGFPLDDPSVSPFVTMFPSADEVQAVADRLQPPILNNAYPNSTLADVQAILDNRYANVSTWTARGMDLLANYRAITTRGPLDLQLNVSKLTVEARAAPTAQFARLSGIVFGPPKLRVRAGASWTMGSLNLSGYINYIGKETDVYAISSRKLSAFTTLDMNVGYAFGDRSSEVLSGLRIDFTALNLLDKSPPRLSAETTVYPGIGYDSTNASPFGRIVTLRVTKDWMPN